jgi:hypothetical protein
MTKIGRSMYRFFRPGDNETGRLGEPFSRSSSPCLLICLPPGLRCLVVFALAVLTGCPRERQQTLSPAASRASVALRVLVVNEPAVVEVVNRLRGEWAERSGGELSATSKSWKQTAEAQHLDADVVIFPSRYMGEFCVRGWLQAIRASVLDSDEFNAGDIFPVVRRQLMRWGGETMALPLGVVPAVENAPRDAHPGTSFLAVAAPDVVSSEGEAILFDSRTMIPRLTDPALVKALQELTRGRSKRSDNGIEFAHWVPVLGFADSMIAVSAETRNGASASKLVAWLASADIGTQLARTAGAPIPVRRSVPVSATGFGSDSERGERTKLADAFASTMNGDKCLLIPRIPGVDEYVAALDRAVNAALKGKMPAEASLEKADAEWEKITDRYGREKQRDAYLKHLNIAD